MAHFTVSFKKPGDYKKNMEVLRAGVAAKQGGIFRLAGGATVHQVTIQGKSGSAPVLMLRASDLYIIGFRNAQGSFYFKDDSPGGDATELLIGCSYTKAKCIGVLRDLGHKDATGKRAAADLQAAIDWMDAHDGAAVNDAGRVNLGLIVYAVSEALRFNNIFQRIQDILGSNKGFTFAEFADFVLNWEKGSQGKRGDKLKDMNVSDIHDALLVWKL